MKTLTDAFAAVETLRNHILFGSPWDELDDETRPAQCAHAHIAIAALEHAEQHLKLAVLAGLKP